MFLILAYFKWTTSFQVPGPSQPMLNVLVIICSGLILVRTGPGPPGTHKWPSKRNWIVKSTCSGLKCLIHYEKEGEVEDRERPLHIDYCFIALMHPNPGCVCFRCSTEFANSFPFSFLISSCSLNLSPCPFYISLFQNCWDLCHLWDSYILWTQYSSRNPGWSIAEWDMKIDIWCPLLAI